jgi:gliding motility-associated-like protein
MAAGEYMVNLTITTSNGCESEMEKQVIVHPDFAVYAPSAFTPNGDGLNEVFEIKGIGIKQYLLQVFSRWGELLYESNNLENHWDGRFNGEFVSPGTYVYTINYKSMLDKDYTQKGTVTVMR